MIKIPPSFKQKLEHDTSGHYIGAVNSTCSRFQEIFSERQLYFFEEFTDHGIRHINSVLESSSKLITRESYQLLSEKDVSILILGVLLHDLGMHIQPLTFNKMIEGGYDDILCADFADEKWSTLWKAYLAEAKKFNDSERFKIFGKTDVNISEPNLNDPDTLTGVHKKLIGEFIRRHHPRIAFEVAFKGLADHNNQQIEFCIEFDVDLKRLAGLLARSHGMNIRDTFSFLNKYYNRTWKRPFEIHIVYLMTVLRLADYFQIDSRRVLKIPFLTKLFRSPVSFEEHQKHLQTKYVQQLDDDPETLYITAHPGTSVFFSALSTLFGHIQEEIDNSWAILGEIYGNKLQADQPKLTYRRLRSNLDDIKEFSLNVNYIPEKIAFTVDKEIPKLLVGPLYGNDPTFGVRELLQNSVDACWEREFFEHKSGNQYTGEIFAKVHIENEKCILSITDNGKGMTLNEIKNYFLKIGGTFRRSSTWRSNYEDEKGHSRINKSGRFGIGILAAYLLGAEIEIKTKSINSDCGYLFRTSLDQEQIEINKLEVKEPGTEIRIVVSKEVLSKLMNNRNALFDRKYHRKHAPMFSHEGVWPAVNNSIRFDKWYTLKSPKVSYEFPDVGPEEDRIFLPGLNEHDMAWNEIQDDQFKKILWSHNSELQQTIICNGFIIPERYELSRKLIAPALMIYDFDAKLPLKLDRTSVDSFLPIHEKLTQDIYRDFVACLLLQEISSPFLNNQIKLEKYSIRYPSILESDKRQENILTLIYCKDGFSINHPACLNSLATLNHLKIFTNPDDSVLTLHDSKTSKLGVISVLKPHSEFLRMELQGILFDLIEHHNLLGLTGNMYIKTASNLARFKQYENDQMKGWKLPNSLPSIYYTMSAVEFNPDIVSSTLIEYLGNDFIIPYDMSERRKKFPKAFERLEKYMQKYLEQDDLWEDLVYKA